MFFLKDGMSDSLCLENSFGNLGRFLLVLNGKKIQDQIKDTLFPNVKRMTLKVLVLPFLDLWKRFRMSLGHEFIGKNSKAIKGVSVRILDLWDFIFREGQCFFASLPSRRPSLQFVNNPETKQGGISVWQIEITRKFCGYKNCFRNQHIICDWWGLNCGSWNLLQSIIFDCNVVKRKFIYLKKS